MYCTTECTFKGKIELFSTLKSQKRKHGLQPIDVKKLDLGNENEIIVLVSCHDTDEDVWFNITYDVEMLYPNADIYSGGFIKMLNLLYVGKNVVLNYVASSNDFSIETPLYTFMGKS